VAVVAVGRNDYVVEVVDVEFGYAVVVAVEVVVDEGFGDAVELRALALADGGY
jgi:hypothetical protein